MWGIAVPKNLTSIEKAKTIVLLSTTEVLCNTKCAQHARCLTHTTHSSKIQDKLPFTLWRFVHCDENVHLLIKY